ncbi:hypothetical protein NIES4101_53590 [Calothrix sp. NIES-4101]|nr:hypothetical protein NIES4101_53590 [Calothrix sp. NIES-4101]
MKWTLKKLENTNVDYLATQTPWGEFALNRRPYYCDRGRYTLEIPDKAPKLFRAVDYQYYFDEEIALSEIFLWGFLTVNHFDQNAVPVIGAVWIRVCNFGYFELAKTVYPFEFYSLHFYPTVKESEQFSFDTQDGFPRRYRSRENAIAECEAWIKNRTNLKAADWQEIFVSDKKHL